MKLVVNAAACGVVEHTFKAWLGESVPADSARPRPASQPYGCITADEFGGHVTLGIHNKCTTRRSGVADPREPLHCEPDDGELSVDRAQSMHALFDARR